MTGLRTPRGRCLTPRAFLLYVVVALMGIPELAHAMVFNITYDSSTVGAPADFFTAFNYAANFYQSAFTDPVTINVQVGWGQINGGSLAPGDLGQSETFQQGLYTYGQMKTALIDDAKTASDALVIANLPVSYPVSGTNFVMSNAEAKALGLLGGNQTGLDGYVGFNSNASFTFDPNNRAVSGKYDFIGLAGHEISEVMGRYGLGQNGASSGRFSPIDLFRYSSAAVLDTTPANGDYFSIDSGITNINTYNGTGGGDLSDWAGLTLDPYNAFLTSGKQLSESPGDMTLMDVIGWDLATPEPGTFSLVLIGVAGLALRRTRVRASGSVH